ncbi:MAG: DNA polymerase III subunit gamma/tau [Chlorobi bacterium]|nr:DNA polymerase III subunit gamma/tau [Chlorobiota bacterium]
MDDFVVSARKYRPVAFKQVVGQNAITSTLQNAIKSKHLAQAFLFTGPRGVGKTTCARILAKTINCENLTESIEPCDSCESCTSFNNNASFNIHELDAASNNSVDDIRSLVDQVRIPPQVGTYKVYIIDEVHMLSQAAFNAFLKTLEEPPAYAKFILATTEKHKILPTILSRCQIFDFRRIKVDDIVEHLKYVAGNENIEAEDEALNVISQKADGALRDALSTFDQIVSYSGNKLTYKSVIENLNILDYEYFFRITESIIHSNIPELLLVFDEITENGFDGQHFIIGLGDHLRNLLVLKNESTVKLMLAGNALRDNYLLQANACSPTMLINALDICNKFDLSYKASNNKRLHIEIALMQLGKLSNERGGFSDSAVVENSNFQTTEKKFEYKTAKKTEKPNVVETTVEAKPGTKEAIGIKTNIAREAKTKAADISDQGPRAGIKETAVNNEAKTPEADNAAKNGTLLETEPQKDGNNNDDDAPRQIKKNEPGRKIKRISITESLRALKEKKEAEDKEVAPVIINEFSQERLVAVWKEFVKAYQAKSPSFASAIGKYDPELSENFEIRYKVDNKIMANDLLHQTSLLEFLKAELKNNQIRLKAVLPKADETKKAYFDSEKFDELAKDFPGIVKLKDQLNLDFGV